MRFNDCGNTKIVELTRQYGLATKARLPLGYVPNVQIVQYVQVVQRTHFGSDGLNDLNGLPSINSGPEQHVEGNYLNPLRASFYAPFAIFAVNFLSRFLFPN
jgi:hypothetical protein